MLALPLAPSTTILLVTGGLLLLYLEFNRPGRVLPGCAGLLLLLTGAASLSAGPHPAATLPLLTLALLFFAVATRLSILLITLTGGASLLFSFLLFTGHKNPITITLDCICAVGLTILTHFLARIAHRARTNKTCKQSLHHLD